jgi:hypothetical protein
MFVTIWDARGRDAGPAAGLAAVTAGGGGKVPAGTRPGCMPFQKSSISVIGGQRGAGIQAGRDRAAIRHLHGGVTLLTRTGLEAADPRYGC